MGNTLLAADHNYQCVLLLVIHLDDPNQLWAYYSHTEEALNNEALSH